MLRRASGQTPRSWRLPIAIIAALALLLGVVPAARAEDGADTRFLNVICNFLTGPGAVTFPDPPDPSCGLVESIGTPEVGEPLMGAWFALTFIHDTGVAWRYSWLRNGVAIPGASGRTYTPTAGDLGKRISAMASVTADGYGWTTMTTGETKPVAVGKLRLYPDPRVSGYARVGNPVEVSERWHYGDGGPVAYSLSDVSVAYQWLREGVVIGGATALAYTPTAADLGKRLSLRTTAVLRGYTTVTKVRQTRPVEVGILRHAKPTISGTRAVGSTLTADTSGWTPGTVFTYLWEADGGPIRKDPTKRTLKLTKELKGKRIIVYVWGALDGYRSTEWWHSVATPRIATAATPKISGKAKAGATLKAKPGTWTSKTKFSYRWYANGKAIAKATKSTLKLGKSLKGKRITVQVTGRKSGYATVSKTSAASKAVR